MQPTESTQVWTIFKNGHAKPIARNTTLMKGIMINQESQKYSNETNILSEKIFNLPNKIKLKMEVAKESTTIV